MKNAEEWVTHLWASDDRNINIIKQIQLDAAKAGMRLAAERCNNNDASAHYACEMILKDVVLSAIDTLTLEELNKA